MQHCAHGCSLVGEPTAQREHVVLMTEIECGGRLVEQQQPGVLRVDACERDSRLLAAGECRDRAFREMRRGPRQKTPKA
ncbi:MAG: hypothetical protein WEC34_15000 [Acidimicrobiia bacterium]